MNRRNFLKSIPVLVSSPLEIPIESILKDSKPRHFIGLGTAAGRFISKYSNLMDFDSFTIIDSIKPENSDIVVEFIWFDPNEFNSGHFQSKTTDILEILPVPGIIKDHLSGLQGGLVFFSCLGNVTGTLLFQSIGFGYKNLSENVQWFATTPFDFEGSRNAARSERAISIVKENQKDPICFSFEEMRKFHGDLTIRKAFEKGDLEILKLIEIHSKSG